MSVGGREAGSRVTLLLLNFAAIVERADEALLPAVYHEVGDAFDASPSRLGALTMVRLIVQAACFPLAAYLSFRYNRAHVVGLGAVVWAVATAGVGFATTYNEALLWRAVNGVGLAVVLPAIQSMVADAADPEARGVAFGWLQLTSNVGNVLGSTTGLLLATRTVAGLPGWRAAFHLTALVSALVGLLTFAFAVDPRFPKGDKRFWSYWCWRLGFGRSHRMRRRGRSGMRGALRFRALVRRPGGEVGAGGISAPGQLPLLSWWDSMVELWDGTKKVLVVPTFQIVVAQGVVGSFPWAALAFAGLWLELVGFSHERAAALVGTFVVATSLGALFAGWLADRLALPFPHTARIACAQFSSGSAVPLTALLLYALPADPTYFNSYAGLFALMGFLISWNASSTNNPIFAEIVPERLRTTIYAVDRSFEVAVAAFAPLTVGFLAEHYFGYLPSDSIIDADKLAKAALDKSNSHALARGLFVTMAIPFALCCIIYTPMYWTYPRDRERGQVESFADALGHFELSAMLDSEDDEEEGEEAALTGQSPGSTKTGLGSPRKLSSHVHHL